MTISEETMAPEIRPNVIMILFMVYYFEANLASALDYALILSGDFLKISPLGEIK